jgi:hypothetical protein
MLILVESQEEKVQAHNTFEANLKKAWPKHEARVVAWRPDSVELTIHHNGKIWFGSRTPNPDDTTPRYWDPFGEYRDSGNLQIAVEINVPTDSNTKRVSGFYARDIETGNVYLMHDGGVGGGQKGVGKEQFLWWSKAGLMPVINAEGDKRLGIIVAPIDASTRSSDVSRFVQTAIDFKLAVKTGETDSPQAREEQRTFQDYYDEFAGKKRRRRVEEIEYISRHGDIVRALRDWRVAKSNENVVKNAYIDLGIRTGDVLTEIYEVKTSCDRQTLYSAIGQIFVHDDSPINVCQRFLVLPDGDQIPDDVTHALKRAGIALLRFQFEGDKSPFQNFIRGYRAFVA